MNIICTLKSSEPDLLLPVGNFSSRMLLDPLISTINVFVPNGVSFADDISIRLGGYIELSFNGVIFAYSDSISSAPLFEGATSTTLQINTSGVFPAIPTPTIDLEGVSFKAINVNGDIRLRAKFDPNIVPGSIVNYDGESHNVTQITVSQSVNSYTMEIFANA